MHVACQGFLPSLVSFFRSDLTRVCSQSRVVRLIGNASTGVTGVVYETEKGTTHEVRGVVILATGGYGADFTPDSLLAKHRKSNQLCNCYLQMNVIFAERHILFSKGPDLLGLPTTNGPHCTGDGIKMAESIGAGLADITQVQVHPTGLVDPSDPDAKVKFLAAEV